MFAEDSERTKEKKRRREGKKERGDKKMEVMMTGDGGMREY